MRKPNAILGQVRSLAPSVFVAAGLLVGACASTPSQDDPAAPAEESPSVTTAVPAEEGGSATISGEGEGGGEGEGTTGSTATPATEADDTSALDALTADPSLLEGPEPPAGFRPVLPTHNRLDADRINLVFDLDEGVEATPELFDPLLSWDGRPRLYEGRAVFGLFAIEPFRSNRQLFNLWVTDGSTAERDEFGLIADGVFPDMVVSRMDPATGRASAEMSQFAPLALQSPAPDAPSREDLTYRNGFIGGLILYANESNFATEGPVLAHELGHALFGLGDEYYGVSGEANPEFVSEGEWPNCANSQEQAEAWWGDLEGTYDPMIDIWIEESMRLGIEFTAAEIDDYRLGGTVELEDGSDGCYGRDGYHRPSRSSLMGPELDPPAFGPVNVRWAERVLALYTGEVPTG